MTPATPSFGIHTVHLDLLRRKAVYHWPPPAGEWIQSKLQNVIEEMTRDGYPAEVVVVTLRNLAELTIRHAQENNCNIPRARFFAELLLLEIQ